MKVKCIDAKEAGIPITEGEVYTVAGHINEVPEWGGEKMKGYYLKEVEGHFRADRFEKVPS